MFEDAAPRRAELQINTATQLLEKHQKLNNDLAEAMATAPPDKPRRESGSAEPTEVQRIAAEIEQLEEQMDEHWRTFVLQPRPKKEYRRFLAEHPPVEVQDIPVGVDMDAFLRKFVPRCVVEPTLTPEDWERAFDEDTPGILPGDQDRLVAVVFGFYLATSDAIPKSRLLSVVNQTIGEHQEQLEALVSPGDGSTGGNRRSGTTTTRETGNSPATRSSHAKQSSTTAPASLNSD